MEGQDQPTVFKTSIKWGIILSLVLIIFGLILNITGNFTNRLLGSLQYVFMLAVIIFAHNDFKSNGDGFMSYGQGLGIGTLTSLVAAVINSIFSYIYLTFVDSTILEEVKEMQMIEMENQGLGDAQIEQAMSFMTPGIIVVFAVLLLTFVGFILSLIISAFTKNSNPELQI